MYAVLVTEFCIGKCYCWPTQAAIGEALLRSRQQINRAIGLLEKRGRRTYYHVVALEVTCKEHSTHGKGQKLSKSCQENGTTPVKKVRQGEAYSTESRFPVRRTSTDGTSKVRGTVQGTREILWEKLSQSQRESYFDRVIAKEEGEILRGRAENEKNSHGGKVSANGRR